jgi:hypothetical protein
MPRADFLRFFKNSSEAWSKLCNIAQNKESQSLKTQINFYAVKINQQISIETEAKKPKVQT